MDRPRASFLRCFEGSSTLCSWSSRVGSSSITRRIEWCLRRIPALTEHYAPQVRTYAKVWQTLTGREIHEAALFFTHPNCYVPVDERSNGPYLPAEGLGAGGFRIIALVGVDVGRQDADGPTDSVMR